MKVILLEENRVAEVTDGHARNFLFPKKLAIVATPVNLKKFEQKIKEKEAEIAAQKKSAQELADKISSFVVVFQMEVGEEGKLFGSVTNQDVVEAAKAQYGIELDKKKVNINEHVGAVGEFPVSVKLMHNVIAHFKIKVEAKETETK